LELEVNKAGSDSVCIYLSQDNGPVASCFKHIYETSVFTKDGEFLGRLFNCQLLKRLLHIEVHIEQYCFRPPFALSVMK
jgi:hypothetical protein